MLTRVLSLIFSLLLSQCVYLKMPPVNMYVGILVSMLGVSSSNSSNSSNLFVIYGTITGLEGFGLVLKNNEEYLYPSANGSFQFAIPLKSGTNYTISVATPPTNPSQTCTVTNGSGVITQNISNVQISCVKNSYTIGGIIVGLSGSGLVLQNNNESITMNSTDTSFVFSKPMVSGGTYSVSIISQPTNQTCSVTNDYGTVTSANILGVVVNCTSNSHIVSGTVKGLTSSGLVLQLNSANDLSVTGSSFAFPTALLSGSTYTVSILTQPSNPPQNCSLQNQTGTISGADVSNVTITCVTNSVNISGIPNGGLNLTEGSGSAVLSFGLKSSPTSDVIVSFYCGNQIEPLKSLTFTASNWNIPQSVNVSAVDDSIAEGLHSGAIIIYTSSNDVYYNGLVIPSINASITDNDSASVAVSTGNIFLTEGGTPQSYTVKLSSQPSGDVRIQMNPGSQVSIVPSTLTFTSANWNTLQTVTVSAVDDSIVEGNHVGAISFTIFSSIDVDYHNITVPNLNVNITDNDVASVVANIVSALSVAEGTASNATYTVRLSSQPFSNVIVTLSSGTQLTVNPSTLTFTNSSWNTGQTITVNAVDDSIDEGTPHLGTISYSVASVDTNYNGILVANTSVSITDNDNVPPSNLVYSGSPYTFLQNTAMSIVPTYTGIVTTCSCTPAIPSGMSLSSNCAISGTPTQSFSATSYIITAGNIHGTTPSATVSISIAVSAPP